MRRRPDEFDGLFEDVYLNAYPNPERVGCPGLNALRGLATKELPISHPAREHIARCSPCFNEFRQLQREIKARRRRGKLLATAAGIVIACGTAITLTQFQLQESVIARWDLQNASPSRDFNDYQQPVHLEAPAKKGPIAVTLPLGSEPGQYEVEVRNDRNSGAIKEFKSTAAVSNQGKTVLQITADFSELPVGDYIVAFRRGQRAWHFARLHVR
jgi:hypothetical protein